MFEQYKYKKKWALTKRLYVESKIDFVWIGNKLNFQIKLFELAIVLVEILSRDSECLKICWKHNGNFMLIRKFLENPSFRKCLNLFLATSS